jgi:pyruvate/2-oxoglutarate dehydrogenase complex dihydrolipoamide dehydrogenase (E3) component
MGSETGKAPVQTEYREPAGDQPEQAAQAAPSGEPIRLRRGSAHTVQGKHIEILQGSAQFVEAEEVAIHQGGAMTVRAEEVALSQSSAAVVSPIVPPLTKAAVPAS